MDQLGELATYCRVIGYSCAGNMKASYPCTVGLQVTHLRSINQSNLCNAVLLSTFKQLLEPRGFVLARCHYQLAAKLMRNPILLTEFNHRRCTFYAQPRFK